MSRWIRRFTLIGAVAALFIGSFFLPWATWKNLGTGKFEYYHVNDTALELMRIGGLPDAAVVAFRPLKDKKFADIASSQREIDQVLHDAQQDIIFDSLRHVEGIGWVPKSVDPSVAGKRYELIRQSIRDRSEGFFASKNAKDQPTCFANAFYASGDYLYKLFVFRKKADGTLLCIVGDPQVGPIEVEGKMVAEDRAEYELIEDKIVASPYWNGSRKVRNNFDPAGSPIVPLLGLAILLVVIAAFLRSKLLITSLALPALAVGFYPLVALRDFVADASKLKLSGIDLDAAIGAGPYVMLAGGVLAVMGGVLVWFEPPSASPAPPATTTTS